MQRKPLKHLSLCSGIGGLDLAAEWAGIRTVAQCEIDGYASRVLEKNFKGVPNLHDIRTVTNERLRERGIAPEEITVISAGFPCQPYSLAGKGRGDRDERDLWGEVKRVIGEVRPRWFVGENTPGLFSRENQRYFRRILSDLAALGYNVGWGIWGACDVGAPHKRERVFLVAHADGERRGVFGADKRESGRALGQSEAETPFGASSLYGNFYNADGERRGENETNQQHVSNACCKKGRKDKFSGANRCTNAVSDAYGLRKQQSSRKQQESRERTCDIRQTRYGGEWWEVEPDVGRVAYGVSARVDRLRCLGNAVVPYQAYPIFKAIADYEKEQF